MEESFPAHQLAYCEKLDGGPSLDGRFGRITLRPSIYLARKECNDTAADLCCFVGGRVVMYHSEER